LKKAIPLLLVLLALLPPRARAEDGADDAGGKIPADLAWITLFADEVRKNEQGFWEAELPDGIRMVYIPAGEFMMGSSPQEGGWEKGEDPIHRVYAKGIWIGKFEVTRALWRAVMGGGALRSDERLLPQADVSFYDVQEFLRALRKKSGLEFRLPTEAEWEKCCRGGSTGPVYGPLNEIAWHVQNSGDSPHPAGSKRPNGFGICDMLGNVWEWCSDWYAKDYYEESPYVNPPGPKHGRRRVVRGGGFLHGGHYLRCAHRNDQDPTKSRPYLGFRLVLDAEFPKNAWRCAAPVQKN
jgi:formylglycine-generating enzyme required for sulfatase activity